MSYKRLQELQTRGFTFLLGNSWQQWTSYSILKGLNMAKQRLKDLQIINSSSRNKQARKASPVLCSYLRITWVPPCVLHRSRALVHVSAPWRAPAVEEEKPISPLIDEVLLKVITERASDGCETSLLLGLTLFTAPSSSLWHARAVSQWHRVRKDSALLVRQLWERAGCFIHLTVALRPS